MNTIEEIKSRLDIVDLVSETVKLRRSGKSYSGFCPFHPNSRTPAFVVFPDSGTWRCFGQCNEGGDIFRFVMKKEGWDFSQALKYLAEKAGVQLQAPTPEVQEAREENERLQQLLADAAEFYRQTLLHTPAGLAALDYLHQRGLNDPILETFQVGYAPNAWEITLHHLTARGWSQEDVLRAGMLSERESGGVYDRFRNRIMIPIRDMNGNMAGFGARVLDPNDVPKFLNSPQTPLFDKGRLLYGLDQARKSIRAKDQVVIVEGYLDIIAVHQAGFTNVVSPMGTALTEDQLRLLKRFTRRIVLALDADAAGEKATLRGLDIARQAMDHSSEPVFEARGLLHYETRLQADVRVTTLPAGLDPDDVVNRDAQEWARLVDSARPVVVHVMETLSAGQDLNDAKVKSRIAAQVLPLIEDVQNPIERESYRQSLARLLRVDERALINTQAVPAQARRSRRSEAPPHRTARPEPASLFQAGPGPQLERYALTLLLRQPEILHSLDRSLQEASLPRLETADFNHTEHQLIFQLLQNALNQIEMDPLLYIQSRHDPSLTPGMDAILNAPLPAEDAQDKLLADLTQAVLRLRRANTVEKVSQLQFLVLEAMQDGQLRVAAYEEEAARLGQLRNLLDHALDQTSLRK